VETLLSDLPGGDAEHSVWPRPLLGESQGSPKADGGVHSVDKPLGRPLLREPLRSPVGRALPWCQLLEAAAALQL